MSKPQKLIVHVHADRKLFHVSMHNVDTKTGTSWQAQAAKARWVYNQIQLGNPTGNDRGLCGGFMLALVNTDYDGWHTYEIAGQFPNAVRALEHKEELIKTYEDQGLVNVGVRSMSSKRDPQNDGLGSKWTASFNPNRMTMAKVNEKIDFINNSLQLEISRSVRSKAVRAVIGAQGDVCNMAQLLRFIRQEMGLA